MYKSTNDNQDLIDELKHEFARQCGYILNESLSRYLNKSVSIAAEICTELHIKPSDYVAAQRKYSPVINKYSDLTPEQLASKDSKNYALQWLELQIEESPELDFEAQCRLFADCLKHGWPERECLRNHTFNFAPWFRILISSERDDSIIDRYGRLAAIELSRNKSLVDYLKTIKGDAGRTFDFSRIPKL